MTTYDCAGRVHARASRTLLSLAAVLVAGLIACTASERDQTTTTTQDSTVPPVPGSAPWTVSASGAGPLTIGMTVADARAALSGDLTVADSAAACTYARSQRAPGGVKFMVLDGHLARVEIDSGSTATTEGAKVGDAESSVMSLYAGRVSTMPHKYSSGRYLIVRAAADTMRRLVFETDSAGVVRRYRAGAMPAVEWVEGCA
jgi:hypothetical protein